MHYFTKSLFSLLVLTFPVITSASSIKQLDIAELLTQSEIVFEGQVIKQNSRWNATKTDILTDITFRIDDVVIGSYSNTELTLSFVGGTIDQTTVTIEGSKMPSLNESGVYFVSSTSRQLVNPIAGWAQGHFLTKRDESGTMRMMTQNEALITELNLNQPKTKYISDGVATGVIQSKSGTISKAMALSDFKSLLREHAIN